MKHECKFKNAIKISFSYAIKNVADQLKEDINQLEKYKSELIKNRFEIANKENELDVCSREIIHYVHLFHVNEMLFAKTKHLRELNFLLDLP